VSVKFGRIGSSGQAKDKTFASFAVATQYYEQLVAEKIRKGYSETPS